MEQAEHARFREEMMRPGMKDEKAKSTTGTEDQKKKKE